MRIIEAEHIAETVRRLYIDANRNLPEDVRKSIRAARTQETWGPGAEALDKIIANFELAEKRGLPICQDTGITCVFLEIGREAHINGNIQQAVDEGVRRGCREGFLRPSVVRDPLNRSNTGDNTPAMLYLDITDGEKVRITVAPKGFGSENMSQIKMLRPSDGPEGVIAFVLSAVETAGPNPCPPIVVGVGIGGAFDKAPFLAKKALLRPLDQRNPNEYYADLEKTLLEKINALGIGPQGFGGRTTALQVAIETMPTHIAGLPCAVNINCHVTRHAMEAI
ncbi:MAG: fumarate hydratase [Spirochaetaceae bacterium]|nr:fumarate hydratase [Spirochaetaceae bacterium]